MQRSPSPWLAAWKPAGEAAVVEAATMGHFQAVFALLNASAGVGAATPLVSFSCCMV